MLKKSVLLLFLIPLFLSAQNKGIPQWVLDDWAYRMQGEGHWITSNAVYKNEQEPYDAYGMDWEWGLGKKSMKGRLYCIKDGKDIGTVWEFLSYWDIEKGEHRMLQTGSDGTLIKGIIQLEKDGSTKSRELFASPGGVRFELGHRCWFEQKIMHTQSYNIEEGVWKKKRFYEWTIK